MKHRDDIDGLRAIAVLSVALFHFNLGGLSGGYTGVDVFFVISGYVIANSIVSDTQDGTFSVSNFYVKRIRRIFPAYAAMLLATTLVACLALLPPDLLDYSKSLLSTAAFASNFYFWKSSGYFAAAAHTMPLLHTWSLAVEEQFYIFAPIMVHFIFRFGMRARAAILIPLIVLSFAVGVLAVFVGPTAGFFLLPTRAWELFLGVLLSMINLSAPSRPMREAMAVVGAALIAFGSSMLSATDPFPGWNALYPCVGAPLIIQAGKGLDGRPMPLVNAVLATKPLVWIGLISYSLYLIHWPIAAFARYSLLREATFAEGCLMLAVSIALAAVSWNYVEQPFRRRGRDRSRQVLAFGASVPISVCAAAGLLILSRGLPERYPEFVEQRIPGTEDWGGETCFHQDQTRPAAWDAATCTRIRGGSGRILLWGDSFAAQYMPGILRNATRIDADLLQYTFAGCPPILSYFSYARVGCSAQNQRVLALIGEQHVDTVVLAARWTDVPVRTMAGLPDTISKLKVLGVRVVVLGQSPQFATDVQRIDYISGARMKPGASSWQVFFGADLNARIAVLAKDAEFIDPMPHLCTGLICPYRIDEDYLFADYGHFSCKGADIAVARYFPKAAGCAACGELGASTSEAAAR